MEFKVKFFAILREITGEKQRILNSDTPMTVEEVLLRLVDQYGYKFEKEIFRENRFTGDQMILVNGVNINSLAGLKTMLKDGDEVSILPPVAGG